LSVSGFLFRAGRKPRFLRFWINASKL